MNKPQPGQVWADNDTRAEGRTLRIESIGGDVMDPVAICTVLTDARWRVTSTVGRTVSIRVRRFRPTSTGYRLIKENEA